MKSLARSIIALCAMLVIPGRGLAETMDPQSILKALDENHARMVKAFVDRDAEAFAECWTSNAVCVIDEIPLLNDVNQLKAVFMDAVGGSSMLGLERLNRKVWITEDRAYETGVYLHRFAITGREQVQSSTKTFVTVWEKQSDGSWKREVEAWNKRAAPSTEQLDEWSKQMPQVMHVGVGAGPATNSDSLRDRLSALEKSFHDLFLTDDVEPAIEQYADDAMLLSGESDWFVGKDRIRDRIMEGRKQVKLVGIECDSVAAGGDGTMAYVVNRFHWKFTPVGGDGQVYDFYGKGLHVWQRQADGEWKILIDINNTNPAPETAP